MTNDVGNEQNGEVLAKVMEWSADHRSIYGFRQQLSRIYPYPNRQQVCQEFS
ncbi:hypothetical protein DOTSEDRAFT_70946 [Dothistroma septosporum NZE10]|uniref:Uncharacterized protein n=1 Tax=Dothistroma septosporum (strain NZE10 / CBS 128990) TaxID=675120 RepID=N1PRN1_DOTSN|nr:hypothetical protein DOTSEDRAFT_70946 [Dothistroma septosporum NZE10]